MSAGQKRGNADQIKNEVGYLAAYKRLLKLWLAIGQSVDTPSFLRNLKAFCAGLERDKSTIGAATFDRFAKPDLRFLTECQHEVSVISGCLNGDTGPAERFADTNKLVHTSNGPRSFRFAWWDEGLFNLVFIKGAAERRHKENEAEIEARIDEAIAEMETAGQEDDADYLPPMLPSRCAEQLFDCHLDTLHKKIESGAVRCIKVTSRKWRIHREDVPNLSSGL